MLSRLAAARSQGPGVKRRLALLVFVWANLAMLPCAMAIGGGESGHGDGHGDAAAMHAHHAHAAGNGGDTVEPDCCDLGDANVAEHSSGIEKTPDSGFSIATFDIDVRDAATRGRLHTTTDPPERSRSAPRLHVINCVYLD